MKKLFKKYLLQAKRNNQLVAIRTDDEDADKFSVGHLLGINDDTVSIRAINPKGQPDGVFTVRTENLYGIDLDDRYIQKLELKSNNLDKIYASNALPPFYSDGDVNFEKILLNAKESNQMIHVNFYRDLGLYGLIIEINSEEFAIKVYTSDGQPDGVSIYLIEDIKNINWDDEDIRILNILKDKNS